MFDDRPGKRAGREDDLLKARVCMNEAVWAGGDGQVELTCRRTQDQHVARFNRPLRVGQAAIGEHFGERGQASAAQQVIVGQGHGPTGHGHGGGKHPDAVQSGLRVAAMKAERHSDKLAGSGGKGLRRHCAAVG